MLMVNIQSNSMQEIDISFSLLCFSLVSRNHSFAVAGGVGRGAGMKTFRTRMSMELSSVPWRCPQAQDLGDGSYATSEYDMSTAS